MTLLQELEEHLMTVLEALEANDSQAALEAALKAHEIAPGARCEIDALRRKN